MLEVLLSVITIVVIFAFIAWLLMQPQSKILRISLPLSIVSFILIYCTYLAANLRPDDPIGSIAGTMIAFVQSYQSIVNGLDYSVLSESIALETVADITWFEALFWFLHVLLVSMLIVSGFAVWGRKAMDNARLRLALLFNKKSVYHIFGSNDGALQLGRNIVKEEARALVVFYSEEYDETFRENISEFGGALIEVSTEQRQDHLEKALLEDPTKVAYFSGVHEQIVNGDKFSDLLARKCVRDHPPYRALNVFGDVPTEPYSAIIVGFGDLGKSCAKWLIENAQLNLNGAKPAIQVVDRDPIAYQRFMIENPAIQNCVTIAFLEANAFSLRFRDSLIEHMNASAAKPKIFICTSPIDAKNAQELAISLEHDHNVKHHVDSILRQAGFDASDIAIAPLLENNDLWTPEIILHRKLDKLAMAMNGEYTLPLSASMSAEERKAAYRKIWAETSEFHRDSSRASCDFLPAMLAISGIEADTSDAGSRFEAKLANDPILLDDLAQIEHNRWSAFHYVNGYVPMRIEEFARRVDLHLGYTGDDAEREKMDSKPQQDSEMKEHVCLTTWEQLPELDKIYARFDSKIADGSTSIQGRDRDNVAFLAQIL